MFGYGAAADCSWQINTPQGMELVTRITEMQVQDSSGCTKDRVALSDVSAGIGEPEEVQCGSGDRPAVTFAPGSTVLVRFTSDQSVQLTGFVLEYQAVAGACVYGSHHSQPHNLYSLMPTHPHPRCGDSQL